MRKIYLIAILMIVISLILNTSLFYINNQTDKVIIIVNRILIILNYIYLVIIYVTITDTYNNVKLIISTHNQKNYNIDKLIIFDCIKQTYLVLLVEVIFQSVYIEYSLYIISNFLLNILLMLVSIIILGKKFSLQYILTGLIVILIIDSNTNFKLLINNYTRIILIIKIILCVYCTLKLNEEKNVRT